MWKEMEAGGGGGGMSETVLWTNSNPSAIFNAQTVNLSDDVNNYDYICVEYRGTYSSDVVSRVYYDASEFANFKSTDSSFLGSINIMYRSAGTTYLGRNFYCASDTSVYFYTAIVYTTASGSPTGADYYCIPTKVIGCKL